MWMPHALVLSSASQGLLVAVLRDQGAWNQLASCIQSLCLVPLSHSLASAMSLTQRPRIPVSEIDLGTQHSGEGNRKEEDSTLTGITGGGR